MIFNDKCIKPGSVDYEHQLQTTRRQLQKRVCEMNRLAKRRHLQAQNVTAPSLSSLASQSRRRKRRRSSRRKTKRKSGYKWKTVRDSRGTSYRRPSARWHYDRFREMGINPIGRRKWIPTGSGTRVLKELRKDKNGNPRWIPVKSRSKSKRGKSKRKSRKR